MPTRMLSKKTDDEFSASEIETELETETEIDPIVESSSEVEVEMLLDEAEHIPEVAQKEPRKRVDKQGKYKEVWVEEGYEYKISAKEFRKETHNEDNLQQLKAQVHLQKEVDIVNTINASSLAQKFKKQLNNQKDSYLKSLDIQEQNIKNQTQRKVFSLIEEENTIREAEQQLLAEKITEKKVGKKQSTKSSEELKFEMDMKRKDIFVKYANLNQPLAFEKIPALVKNFDNLKENQQREVFKSLKLGHTIETAKVELLRDEKDASKHAKVKESLAKAAKYQEMLKQIIPKYFTQEYETLQQIQSKKQNVEEMFKKAADGQVEKIAKIEHVQNTVKQHINDEAKTLHALQLAEEKMPDPYDPVIFKEHQEQIVELKNVLSKVPDEITSQEIEIEKHNQSAQAQAEYEAEQAKNLMTMVAQQQTEFRQKLKKAALRSEEREKIVNDKSVSMNEEVQVTPHVSATFDHSEFIKTLKKFNVDPTWLKNTQTKHLNDLTSEVKAEELAYDFVSSAADDLNKLVNKNVPAGEMRQYLSNQLDAYSRASGIAVNDPITEKLRKNVQKQAFNPPKRTKVQPPSIHALEKEEYQPAHKADRLREPKEILTYGEYNFRKIQELNRNMNLEENEELEEMPEEYTLMNQMSLAKRDAWLNIYNDFLEYKQAYNPEAHEEIFGDEEELANRELYAAVRTKADFYELFRNWDVKQNDIPEDYEDLTYLPRINIDENGNRVVEAIDPEVIAQTTEDMLLDQALEFSKVRPEKLHHEDEDFEADLREARRQEILEDEGELKEAVLMLEAEHEASFGDTAVFDAAIQQEYKATVDAIEADKLAFKEEYGVDVYDMPQMLSIEIDESVCAMPEDIQDEFEPAEIAPGEDAVFLRERYERQIQEMDDVMVQEIEAHLAGLPRVSSEFGRDHVYEADKAKREGQVFDQQNYEALKEEQRSENLSPYARQQELLFRAKQNDVAIQIGLAEEAELVLEATGERSIGDEGGRPLSAEAQVLKDLEEVEERVRARLVLQEQGSAEAVNTLMNKIAIQKSRVGSLRTHLAEEELEAQAEEGPAYEPEVDSLASYRVRGGNVPAQEEDVALARMAVTFEEFDLSKIPTAAHAAGPVVTNRAVSLEDKLREASSSGEVIEAAGTQNLSPQDQKLADLYDPAHPLRENFLRTKYQMHVNEQLRRQLARKIIDAQDHLDGVRQLQGVYVGQAERLSKQFASDVMPRKDFAFIEDPVEQAFEVAASITKFDPKSKCVDNFNDELRVLVSQQRHGQDKQSEMNFVLKQMKQNGVKPNDVTNALLFSRAVHGGDIKDGNILLKKGVAALDQSDLQAFFDKSVRNDNFDGLGHLINYVEANSISTAGWDINKFRPALEFYLNHSFDLQKLLTFTRFYAHSLNCALASHNITADSSVSEKQAVFEATFGKVESLVDMNALFEHLVAKVGNRTLVDPVSRQDPMMALIEFFTQPSVMEVSRFSQQGTTFISNDSMAEYLVNHLTTTNGFDNLASTVIRLNSDDFSSNVLDHLRQLKKMSASRESIRAAYQQADTAKLSEKTAEFLLFAFKSQDMIPEAIDLCENYPVKNSEIRNFYMSDALLQLTEVDNHYHELVDSAVYQGNTEGAAFVSSMTKAHLKDGSVDHALKFFQESIQSRKELKQKQEDHLVKLFDSTFGLESSGASMEDFKQKYASLMMLRERTKQEVKAVSQLEQILRKCDPAEIENVFLLQTVIREESQLIQELAHTQDSNLDAVLSEFQSLEASEIRSFVAGLLAPYCEEDSLADAIEGLTERLTAVKERKSVLEQAIQQHTVDQLANLIQTMGDGQVQIMGHVSDLTEGLQQLGISEQDYQNYLNRQEDNSYMRDVMSSLKGDAASSSESINEVVMSSFNRSLKALTGELLAANEKAKQEDDFGIAGQHFDQTAAFEEEQDIRGVGGVIDDLLLFDGQEAADEDYEALQKYRDFLYNSKSEAPEAEDGEEAADIQEDEEIREEAYYGMVDAHRDQLTEVLTDRRQATLGKALEMFNKVQGLKLSSSLERNMSTFSPGEIDLIDGQLPQVAKLSSTDGQMVAAAGLDADALAPGGQIAVESELVGDLHERRLDEGYYVKDTQQISSVLDEFERSLVDRDSEILQGFTSLMDYRNGADLHDFEDFSQRVADGEEPIERYIRHAEKMDGLMLRIDELLAGMGGVGAHLNEHIELLADHWNHATEFEHKWNEVKNEKVQAMVEEHTQKLFGTLKEGSNDGSAYAATFSREEKLAFMEQALSIELGGYQPMEVFSTFYCHDLISFGMKHNIPEAVRLGEKMVGDNGDSLPFELAKRVKQWMLTHNMQYQEAMKRTGPINTSSVYKTKRGQESSMVNADDPYWQEFMRKNYRSQDYWKLPSAMAWDYKEHGILDEVVDMQKVKRNYEALSRM